MNYIDDAYVSNTLKKRDKNAHKGNFGKVLIFAGSTGMAGAAILCGRSALSAGSGLVRFLIPSFDCDIYPILQEAVPEATCLSYESKPELSEYDAIAAGCGIGKSEEALKILEYILFDYEGVLVLDADALNLISENQSLFESVKNSHANVIITPHVGEAKRLLGNCADIASLSDRKNATYDLSRKYNCIALLKGAGTLVVDAPAQDTSANDDLAKENDLQKSAPRGSFDIFYENTTGNPGMATGGSGDVLTGIITSLAGQGYKPFDAAKLGAFLHGKAGDIAAEALGEMSVTAGEIVKSIPPAIKEYY